MSPDIGCYRQHGFFVEDSDRFEAVYDEGASVVLFSLGHARQAFNQALHEPTQGREPFAFPLKPARDITATNLRQRFHLGDDTCQQQCCACRCVPLIQDGSRQSVVLDEDGRDKGGLEPFRNRCVSGKPM